MPFIGTQPEVGGYSVLDALTASATANYTLQLNSANFVPNSANQLLVSLNGVIQKAGSSFTVSGSTLTFSSALTSSDSIDFILAMGEPLLIGTPSDGTVTSAKLATGAAVANIGTGAIATAKLANDSVTTAKLATNAVRDEMPAGAVIQTINATTNTEFQFSSANSWVNTGLFSMTFPNALQSGSKVLCTIYATLGEAFNNSWGSATMLSIFENTTNKGDATWGMVNGNAQMTGNASYTQYECNRLVGSILFTPSVTNGTYKLYANQKGAGTKVIGGVINTDAAVPQGATQLTLQEIAQ